MLFHAAARSPYLPRLPTEAEPESKPHAEQIRSFADEDKNTPESKSGAAGAGLVFTCGKRALPIFCRFARYMARSLPRPSARVLSDGAVCSPRLSVPLPDMPLCFAACCDLLHALFPAALFVHPGFPCLCLICRCALQFLSQHLTAASPCIPFFG